ncbi:P1 family peptidase [Enterovirga rhinocerotis]|uniref:L-aminopeptidase/D-esterase-like protein n=1 Tax=Enterovirga rhinocerotis TaxID=1339210 RepID=A0A4R7C7H1_9HYPH|nr:P1 family peptidase [Enterovirga rhinocerotis]TDR94348.1 L-aminopeptidase/D-esterase-like protein [Enterovirga rhinocerotis]
MNLLIDIGGLTVGQAQDEHLASGVTVVVFDEPAIAGVAVLGGAPAGRDQECLLPDRTVERVDALVLSGGSSFGLDATTGVQAWLRERGRGIAVGNVRVPIVPTAILFDLVNGGDKDWGQYPPYRELGYAACQAAGTRFDLGTAGAGYGATTVDLKGGLGSASIRTTAGHTVAAVVAVNAIGSAMIGNGPHFWAAPYEIGGEFGGLGWPAQPTDVYPLAWKGQGVTATTIGIVATDAVLTKAQATRLAAVAGTGLGKALRLSHASMDGDTIFAAATGQKPLRPGLDDFIELAARASDCVARALARGVYEATALPFPGSLPSWRDRHDK